MNRGLEFHDSTIRSVVAPEGRLTIELAAYIHESHDRAGIDSGKVYQQTVLIEFAHCSDKVKVFSGKLADGEVRVDNASYRNLIPIPFSAVGSVAATFVFVEPGAHLVISAGSISVLPIGEARYMEEFG